jgi:hypothetical protein
MCGPPETWGCAPECRAPPLWDDRLSRLRLGVIFFF